MILQLIPTFVGTGGGSSVKNATMTVGTTGGLDGWFNGVIGSITPGTTIVIGTGAGRIIDGIYVQSDANLIIDLNGSTNQNENALVKAVLEDSLGNIRTYSVGGAGYTSFSSSKWTWSADDAGLAITTTTQYDPADAGSTRSIQIYYDPNV